jgi:hypothetical protein
LGKFVAAPQEHFFVVINGKEYFDRLDVLPDERRKRLNEKIPTIERVSTDNDADTHFVGGIVHGTTV